MIKLSVKQNIICHLTQFIIAIAVTTVLFNLIEYLSRSGGGASKLKKEPGVMVSLKEPPPPPEPVNDKMNEIREKKQNKKMRIEQPRLGIKLLHADVMGGIKIPDTLRHGIELPEFDLKIGFNLDEIDTVPVVTQQFSPRYPYHAKREGIEGIVSIRFLVTREGRVEDISIIKADPKEIFDEVTRQCVSRWKFKPGIKDGETVDTWVEIDIEFELDKRG
ncbi:MAG: energy transducer TonB [Desulfobacteraceae bacterium]|jgi:protein TonB